MTLLKLYERFWCTYFPTTLDGNTRMWFKTLVLGIISNFAQLKYAFLTNFMQLRRYRGDIHVIIGCKQKEGELVKNYIDRFTKATLDTPGQKESMVTGAFTWGLFSRKIIQKKFWGRHLRHDMSSRSG